MVSWNSWQGISGGATLGVGVILLIVFFVNAYRRYRSQIKIGYAVPWHLGVLSFATMLLIYSSAALSATHMAWVTILLVIAAILLIFFVYTLYILFSRNEDEVDDWLKPVWTPRKGYGGTIFGDYANAIGVVAGVGAYAASPLVTWWWLGHIGALLAILVGVSLAIRWFKAALPGDDDDRARKWFAFYNVAVGIGTLVSVMAPSFQGNTLELELVNSLPVLIIWGVFILAFLILSIGLGVWHLKIRATTIEYKPITWIALIILFISGAAFLGMFKPIASMDWSARGLPKYSGLVFGLLAGFAWVAAEIHNIVNVIKSQDSGYEKFFKSMKSGLEVSGGLVLILFVFFKFFEKNYDGMWVMVLVGGILAIIGTFMGMIIGVYTLRKKQKQRDRQAIQLGRINQLRRSSERIEIADHSIEDSVVVMVEENNRDDGEDSERRNQAPIIPQALPRAVPILQRVGSETDALRRSRPPLLRTTSGTELNRRKNTN